MKSEPNRDIYVVVLRKMSPAARLKKAFELNELGKCLLRQGLQTQFPEASAAEFQKLFMSRIDKCHNRNY